MARNDERRGKVVLKRLAISLAVVVALLGGLAAALWMMVPDLGDRISHVMGWTSDDYEGTGHGETTVAIVPGEIGSDVADALEEAGVVKTSEVFYELLLEQDPAVEFLPGLYTVKNEMSAQSALDALQDPANRVEFRATIPEGRTVAQTLEIVSAGAQIPLEDLQKAAEDPQSFGLPKSVKSLEGWLYPATYEYEPDTTAEEALSLMIGYQVSLLDELGVAKKDRQEVLTLASVVEKEAGRAEDFGKVARVIENRLDDGMLLQMDSTAQFGYGQSHDGSVWSSDEALADDNKWNTYVHQGLPIGPIANPGRAAVEAAVKPEKGDWLYFAAVNLDTGESVFSSTLADHEKAVAQLREWCDANPDKGC